MTYKDGSDRLGLTYGRKVSLPGRTFTIRNVKEIPLTMGDLVAEKEASVEMAAWLWFVFEKGASGLIFGSTDSGKTTLLSALLAFVPYPKKILVMTYDRWLGQFTSLDQSCKTLNIHDRLVSPLGRMPDNVNVYEMQEAGIYALPHGTFTDRPQYITLRAESLNDLTKKLTANIATESHAPDVLGLVNSMNFIVHIGQVLLSATGLVRRRRVLNIWENRPAEYRTHGMGKVSIEPEFVKDRLGRGLFTYTSMTDSFEGLSDGVLEGYLLDYFAGRDGMSHEAALKDLNRRATVINYIVAERAHLNSFQMYLAINYYGKVKKLKESWLKYAVNLPYEEGI